MAEVMEEARQQAQKEAERRRVEVRNRRMVRMKQLLDEGEFFSMWNMQDRAPLLYHEHVGRFEEAAGEGDAMETEGGRCEDGGSGGTKSESGNAPVCLKPGEWRDNNKVSKTLADLLLHSMDNKDMKARRDAEKERQDGCEEESEEDSDEEEVAMRSAMEEDAKDGKSQFSAEEVRRLKSEFLKLMMERFLQGMERDYFDYGECDDDAGLDDLEQIGRDAEDEYFEEEEGGGLKPKPSRAELFARFQAASVRGEEGAQISDDLDY